MVQDNRGLLNSAEELRRLIYQNPGLPLLVFATEDANNGEYYSMSCSDVRARVGEYLDYVAPCNDKICYCDRDDFEEDMRDCFADDYPELSDEEFDKRMELEIAKYDQYWVRCIIVTVGN
jgi:hypothetical protein